MTAKGRPLTYTQEIAEAICDKLAEGISLREICKDQGMPPESTVRRWAVVDQDGFAAHYARAREIGYHAMADELLEISDDATNDWMRANGDDDEAYKLNGEHVQRSRLRVDSRKWLMSKALPKIYGDRKTVEGPGEEGEHEIVFTWRKS